MKFDKKQTVIWAAVALAALSAVFLTYPISDIVIYASGMVACFALAKHLGIKNEGGKPKFWTALTVSFPAFAIAVNNFPWVAYFTEKPQLAIDKNFALTVALCLACAAFEETMFRYLVMHLIMDKKRYNYIVGILLCGAIFGAYHILNIFFGASVGYTLLQVTYTTLIGSMLCVVYDKTKRLWICVLIHFVYNVGGDSVNLLGIREQWVMPEVLLTVAVSVLVLVFYVVCVLKDRKKS